MCKQQDRMIQDAMSALYREQGPKPVCMTRWYIGTAIIAAGLALALTGCTMTPELDSYDTGINAPQEDTFSAVEICIKKHIRHGKVVSSSRKADQLTLVYPVKAHYESDGMAYIDEATASIKYDGHEEVIKGTGLKFKESGVHSPDAIEDAIDQVNSRLEHVARCLPEYI